MPDGVVCVRNDEEEKTDLPAAGEGALHELYTNVTQRQTLHGSAFDFFFDVLGLADSAGSGEPGGSVSGLGASSTSPSGSRGREGSSESPEKETDLRGL